MEAPLSMHNMEQAVRVLPLNRDHERTVVDVHIFITLKCKQMIEAHQRKPVARSKHD